MKMDDIIRHFNELAVTAGKARLSEQTGFVHHHYHIEGTPQAIPVLENFIFAYSLLRKKSAESIQEAKTLLEKLLHFQCREGIFMGNFPIYLHDYPQCKDRLLAIELLPVFYWIIKQFSPVLGSELNSGLLKSARELLHYSLQSAKEKPLPYTSKVKLMCSLIVFDELFEDESFEGNAEEILNNSEKDQPTIEWFSPTCLGDLLIALQLLGTDFSANGWPNLWKHVCDTYSKSIGTYVGPSYQNYYWKDQPQLTVYDFFMNSCVETMQERLEHDSITQLHASLIQPHENALLQKDLPHFTTGNECSYYVDKTLAISSIEHQGNKLDSLWKGILPLHLLTLCDGKFFSLVAQGGNYQEIKGNIDGPSVQLDYLLPPEVDVEHKEEKREVVLSFTRNDALNIRINGNRSNTFNLGDTITIYLKDHQITVSFELIEGEGRFIGHLMPGNRASQLALKNSNRFNAYDWQLFLRTLTRKGPCRIRAHITVLRVT